jgi:uncharacterized repeat protein (TIGR03803 family)
MSAWPEDAEQFSSHAGRVLTGLVVGNDGLLYGMTAAGGASGFGTVNGRSPLSNCSARAFPLVLGPTHRLPR